ncbi:MAG: hypothetical protein ABI693_05410 [Bryobacteraceae bacterium]
MFDSLDETMKHDDQEVVSNKEKILRWVVVGVVSVLVFGGLFFGVSLLE